MCSFNIWQEKTVYAHKLHNNVTNICHSFVYSLPPIRLHHTTDCTFTGLYYTEILLLNGYCIY